MTYSVKRLEDLGRIRLSENFFLRDFLHSEISQCERVPNFPVNESLLVRAGQELCRNVLEPIEASLGKISIRSAYRSPQVNQLGNEKKYNCSRNDHNHARHIWDVEDSDGNFGATACVVVNSFVEYYEETKDWMALAWWIHDHIPAYREMTFYPKLAAFNINWYSDASAEKSISSQVPNPHTGKKGILTRSGMSNFAGDHSSSYRGWSAAT
jgi:hypothetical protein